MIYYGNNYTEKDLEGRRVLIVPSGIGEFQWAWTKLLNAPGDEKFFILGLDGAPRRLHQFCELHPRIAGFGYNTHFDYTMIRHWIKEFQLDSWEAVTSQFALGTPCAIACNPHLEAGRALAEWLPDLPTTYHYPLEIKPEHRLAAARYLHNAEPDDMLIGISCASYRGAAAWHTWGTGEWLEFLHGVQREYPNARFVLLGGSWDDLTASVFDEDTNLRWATDHRGIPSVGRTLFGAAVDILRRLDGYIGFSSGLGHVAAHCCDTPVFMLWPDHEQPLSRSWVDPELLESGHYVPSPWLAPSVVMSAVRPWLNRIQERVHA